MKDKDKIIEEMARDLHSTHAISSVCSGKDCNHCNYDSLKNFDEYTCIDLSLANDLYNAGYRKLDDHAIMVLRKAKGIENRIRKETAEKILRDLYSEATSNVSETVELTTFQIEQLAKQFGLEIKE